MAQIKALAPVMELKEINAETGVFTGYASVYNKVDSYGDSIFPGAYAESLNEHKRNGTMPKLFWCHDNREPLGKFLDAAEDGRGLYVEGRLNLKVQRAREAYALLSEGDLDGMSIGYVPIKAEPHPTKPGVQVLKQIRLLEVSLVPIGADRFARVTGVKADRWADLELFAQALRDGAPPPIKDFEQLLRDAGVPKAMALRIASVGYAKAIRSDSEGEQEAKSTGMDQALAEMRAALAGFTIT
jgi:HK97 family phage prohead protease